MPRLALNDLLQKFNPIIPKSNNDIGQTDLIEMHIAAMPDASPVAAHPYSLALKHHDLLKQEIKNLLNEGIIHKSMSPWVSLIVVVEKHTPKVHCKNFDCASTTENLTHCCPLSPLPQVPRHHDSVWKI